MKKHEGSRIGSSIELYKGQEPEYGRPFVEKLPGHFSLSERNADHTAQKVDGRRKYCGLITIGGANEAGSGCCLEIMECDGKLKKIKFCVCTTQTRYILQFACVHILTGVIIEGNQIYTKERVCRCEHANEAP